MELRDPRTPALSAPSALGAGAARLALLAGPTLLAFHAGGYFERPRLVAAIVAWALVALLAVAAGPPRALHGAPARWALGGLAALTAWTLLARSWAPLAGPAGEDVQRDALYLGALAAGALAWRPRRWAAAVEPALVLGALVVIVYALADRLAPGLVSLDHAIGAGGRLDQPLTYWNATGALAAIALVLAVRIAGDRSRPSALRAAAAGAAVPLALGLYLTFSRGALGAAGCGLLVLAVLAPGWAQLRAASISLPLGIAAALVASRLAGVRELAGDLARREAEGAVMLAVLAALAIAAVALQARACRAEERGRVRTGPLPLARWVRPALVAAALAVAALPYAAAIAGERGAEARAPAFGQTTQRLGSVGSNRYAYWRVAVATAREHPLRGAGPSSFGVRWLRERPFPESVRDAHSLYLETLAELGLAGFLALLALLGGVALGAGRAWRADPGLAAGPAAGLAVWAVHAGVDWDWEMPAVTLVAVTLAGLLLARSAPSRR